MYESYGEVPEKLIVFNEVDYQLLIFGFLEPWSTKG